MLNLFRFELSMVSFILYIPVPKFPSGKIQQIKINKSFSVIIKWKLRLEKFIRALIFGRNMIAEVMLAFLEKIR